MNLTAPDLHGDITQSRNAGELFGDVFDVEDEVIWVVVHT
jgi:hypothetical protein